MTFSKPFYVLLFAGGMSYASSLAVYQDNTFYTYTPSTDFVGLTQGVSAKCDGNSVAVRAMDICPPSSRLCQELQKLDTIKEDVKIVDANSNVLAHLMTLPQPTMIDAAAWIESAKLISIEQATLSSKKEALSKQLKRQELLFRKQAPSREAKQTSSNCQKELELTLPHGYVSFSTSYEANIQDKEVAVTQNLSIINRSGVDIEADTAMFYYRSANQYVRPIHFSPWIVKKYEPVTPSKYKTARAKSAPMMELSMVADSTSCSMHMPVPTASYEDAREYKIEDLTLPSTGVPLDVHVLSWNAPLDCEVKAYPYINTKAFEVCSFTPKYQIDTNSWKVKSGMEVINERAVGEYRDGKYNLYTQIEEDIKILRKPIVQKERETGIFGGTARKKDGYTLTLTNKSDKVKTLTLIDRIPTSTTEEIKSKLLNIDAEKKVDYKMLKDGEIEMHITLNANETKKIDVLFEISYDKDLKVNY